MNELLDLTVAEARARFLKHAHSRGPSSGTDAILFAVATAAGILVGAILFALVLPAVPAGLMVNGLRRRRVRQPSG
jgi:hypothetical protein